MEPNYESRGERPPPATLQSTSNFEPLRLSEVYWAAIFTRGGLTLRSRYKAHCLRRERFSAARARRGHRLTPMNLRASSHKLNMVRSTLGREANFGINERIWPGLLTRVGRCRKGGPSAPPNSRLSPSVRPAPRAACGCKLRGVRDLEIIRMALQRWG